MKQRSRSFLASLVLTSILFGADASPLHAADPQMRILPVDAIALPGGPTGSLLTVGQISSLGARTTVQLQRRDGDGKELPGGAWIFEENESSMNRAHGFVGNDLLIHKRDVQQNHSVLWMRIDTQGRAGRAIVQQPLLSEQQEFITEDFWINASASLSNQKCFLANSQYRLKTYLEIQCIQTGGAAGPRFAYALDQDESLTGFKNTLQMDSKSNFYVSTQTRLLAFDSLGHLLWQKPSSATQLRLLTHPSRKGEFLLATHPSIGTYAVNPKSGKELWRLPNTLGSSFDVSDDGQHLAIGRIVMKSDRDDDWDMSVSVLRLADRSVVWTQKIDGGHGEFLGAVQFDPSSNVWISGQSVSYTTFPFRTRHENTLTVRFGPDGQELMRHKLEDGGMTTFLGWLSGRMVLMTLLGDLHIFGQN